MAAAYRRSARWCAGAEAAAVQAAEVETIVVGEYGAA
jgi:hypothetical protein